MRQMGVREFVRGGYRTIKEPTLISSHSRVLFTVLPHSERQFVEGLLRASGGKPDVPKTHG